MLTELQALVKSAAIWEELSKGNFDLDSDIPIKKQIYDRLNLETDAFFCPVCQYVTEQNIGCKSCIAMPIWKSEMGCLYEKSPYSKFTNSGKMANKQRYAKQIHDGLNQLIIKYVMNTTSLTNSED